MQGPRTKQSSLTRRSFLKTSALAVGAVSLGSFMGVSTACTSPDAEKDAKGTSQVFFQSCEGNCSGWGCPFDVHVKDGYVYNITKPNPRLELPDGTPSPYQGICSKGYSNIERMYSEARVQYPMKRAGERGAGEWERISWDEALDEICTTWKDIQEKYDPSAVLFLVGGGGDGSQSVLYMNRLKTLMGGMTYSVSFDMSGVMGQIRHSGGANYVNGQNEHRDIVNAETIFVWGANPSESWVTSYHFISDAQEKGAKLIVIDPVVTTTAAKADKYVPIRPGTDGLLAAGMAQIAIRDGKTDAAHLQAKTVAPFLVKDEDGLYLRLSDIGKAKAESEDDRILVYENGAPIAFDEATNPEIEGSFEVEGISVSPAYQILLDRIYAWDLETIATYTDIPIETIEELAALYTSGLSMVVLGYGIDHYANAQTGYDGIFSLASITGQECKHGAGNSCVDWSGGNAQGIIPTLTADLEDRVPGPVVHSPNFSRLIEEGSLGSIKVAPKSIYISGCNPLGNEPDRQKWIAAVSALDLVVVVDPFMSETALYADIVLPAAFLFEKSDLSAVLSNTFIKYKEKASEPLFEAKTDFDIACLLGQKMGFGEYFTQTHEEYLKSCITNEVAKEHGVTWERLQEEHAIWSYPEEPVVIGLTQMPTTPTGRLEFYYEGVQPMADIGQEFDARKESCWFWEPPLEAWHENPLIEKYPLIFISERSKFKTHTMFNNASMLLEIDPEPYIKINPIDAEARGISEGDTVRLFNDRGYVVLKAVINPGCRPGLLVIDHGWERDNFIDGHYSDLSSRASWPVFPQDNWFDVLCQMEKVQ